MKPQDDKGRFVPMACPLPNCGVGTLQHEGNGIWRCDGLAYPQRDEQELEACEFTHISGEPYRLDSEGEAG